MRSTLLLAFALFVCLPSAESFPLPPTAGAVHEAQVRAIRHRVLSELMVAANRSDPTVNPNQAQSSEASILALLHEFTHPDPTPEETQQILSTVSGPRLQQWMICALSEGSEGQQRYARTGRHVPDTLRMMLKQDFSAASWRMDPLLAAFILTTDFRHRRLIFHPKFVFADEGLHAFALAGSSGVTDDRRHVFVKLVERMGHGDDETFMARLRDTIRDTQDSDPWLLHYVSGRAHIVEAWQARGRGRANTVTDKGWQGFKHHIEEARKHLSTAHELRPDLPYAATAMITVTMGGGGEPSAKVWFSRAITAQVDSVQAFEAIQHAMMPRWGGDLSVLVELAKMCAESRRPDTELPIRAIKLLEWVAEDMATPLPLMENPAVFEILSTAVADVAAGSTTDSITNAHGYLVRWAWLGQHWQAFSQAVSLVDDMQVLEGGDTFMSAKQIQAFVALLESHDTRTEAIALEKARRQRQDPALLPRVKALCAIAPPAAADYLNSLERILIFQEAMTHVGRWHTIEFTTDFAGFFTSRGTAHTDGKTLTLTSDQYGYTVYFQGWVPDRYEVEVEIQPMDTQNGGICFHAVPYIKANRPTWFSFRVGPAGDKLTAFMSARLGVPREEKEVPAGATWHRLRAQCTPEGGTFSVDGKVVFTYRPWPEIYRPPQGNLGLGGYRENWSGLTLRFRKFRIRSIE